MRCTKGQQDPFRRLSDSPDRPFDGGAMARALQQRATMSLAETIPARQSVRAYLPEPVDQALVQSLLLSAVQAPSAMNRQPWLFAVVQDRTLLERYSDAAKRQLLCTLSDDAEIQRLGSMLRDERFNIFYGAPTLIVIGSATRERFAEADCWLAAENLMLAANEAGLGSCCIGIAVDLLNTSDVKGELGMPASSVVVAPIVVGHPAALPPAVARAAPKVTAWLRQSTGNRVSESDQRARYAREHPAGYLASRPAPPVTERAGHPLVHDDPGFGAFGRRRLPDAEREFTLGSALPEQLVDRVAAAGQAKKGTPSA